MALRAIPLGGQIFITDPNDRYRPIEWLLRRFGLAPGRRGSSRASSLPDASGPIWLLSPASRSRQCPDLLSSASSTKKTGPRSNRAGRRCCAACIRGRGPEGSSSELTRGRSLRYWDRGGTPGGLIVVAGRSLALGPPYRFVSIRTKSSRWRARSRRLGLHRKARRAVELVLRWRRRPLQELISLFHVIGRCTVPRMKLT